MYRATETKAGNSLASGYTERFGQTLLDEFYKVVFRKKVYTSVGSIFTIKRMSCLLKKFDRG